MTRRGGLALVLVLFCLPLFVGLRNLDLETDEGIYSFAVARILEAGDWLQPKSVPSETEVFLEKPPLKFWIVAAPIRAGLLSEDEFGLRFWDALFGGIAFLYIFSIGSLLAGPICGFVAVLLLFVHWPLLFDHGLRTNNMEAPLFLCYCGGVFHFLKWSNAAPARGRLHAVSIGLYFVLGFMTKFVAAIFLPAILGGAALLVPSRRSKLAADWKLWVAVSALALGLIAPWFIYAQVKFGNLLWHTMLAQHVYTRFTTWLNPVHVQPWSYYFTSLFKIFSQSGVEWLVLIGVIVLLVQAVRSRSLELAVIPVWMVPLLLISAGSSKLYHYTYPFLPPFTLAAGYVVALTMKLAPAVVRKSTEAFEEPLHRRFPALKAAASHPWLRGLGTLVTWTAAALAVGALLFGTINLSAGATTLFKSSGFVRPIAAILFFAILTRRSARVASLVVALAIASWMPAASYRQTLSRLLEEKHPMRDASDCILRLETLAAGPTPPGLYVDTDAPIWHPIYYYFRRIRPWTRQQSPSAELLARTLHDPSAMRPSLVWDQRYQDYINGPDRLRFLKTAPSSRVNLLEYVLLLPGPYSACSPDSAARQRQ